MNYRFFLRKFGDFYTEVYRIPDNGKSIMNNIPCLEKYLLKGNWSNNSSDIRGLVEDISTGYFCETTDEISEAETLSIIKTMDANELQ